MARVNSVVAATAAVPATEAAPIKASTVAEVPREVLANAAARAGRVLAAVAADPVAVVEVVEDAGEHDWKNGMMVRQYSRHSNIPVFLDSTPVSHLVEEEAMLHNLSADQNKHPSRKRTALAAMIILALTLCDLSLAATPAKQKSFATPEEAVKAAVAAARNNDDKELLAIYGPQANQLLFSGDPVADKQRRERFLAAYDEKVAIASEGESRIVKVGNSEWPYPIPLVKKGEGWVFDTNKGREEILNRRIGQNELDAIQVSLAYVDAQREFATKDRNRDGLLEYAQKFRSDPGKKNGLYWEAKAGEAQSPLGLLVADARSQGYGSNKASDKPVPYRGYYYRILTTQGKDAAGGAYSYIVKGKMIGGFALVAYPAEYGNSGLMTFIVNHDGKVFQKDLGKNTAAAATAMKEYNPDKTWMEVKQ